MKYYKKHSLVTSAVLSLFLFAFLAFPSLSLAVPPPSGQTGGGTTGGQTGGGTIGGQTGSFTQLQNPIKADTIQELLAKILEIIVAIGVPIVIFFLVYVGFLFVMARGNPEQISTAKNAFLWTVIGGVVLLGAQLLSSVVENTVNQITG